MVGIGPRRRVLGVAPVSASAHLPLPALEKAAPLGRSTAKPGRCWQLVEQSQLGQATFAPPTKQNGSNGLAVVCLSRPHCLAHMLPKRRRGPRDLRGQLLVGAGDVLPKVSGSARRSRSNAPTSPRAHGQNVVLIDERVTAARHCVRKTTAPLHVLEVERREP